MNKKLIAIALATLPVAALADVTLYGQMKGSLEHDTVSGRASQNKIDDDTSIVGVKGSEDLGNGSQAIWQVENRVHLDGTGNDGFGSRETFVGLDGGDLGKIRLGNLSNTLNDQYTVDQWQYNGNISGDSLASGTVSGANGLAVFTNSGERIKNAIRYDSATFSGFSANLMYGFGENQSKDSMYSTRATRASNIAGLGLNYTYGGIDAHYAIQRESNPNQPLASQPLSLSSNDNNNATKQLFSVNYHDDNLLISGAYQVSTGYDWADDMAGDAGTTYAGTGAVAGKLKARQAAVSLGYRIGAFTPKISYAKGWNLSQAGDSIADSGYTQVIVGVDYALSKRTTAGVSYGNLKFGSGSSVATALNQGQDLSMNSLALTMAHSF